MADATTQTRPLKRDKRDRTHLAADDIVSPNGLATHLGMSRQNVGRLTAETVLVQRSDGCYDQTANRLRTSNTYARSIAVHLELRPMPSTLGLRPKCCNFG